VHYEGSVDGLFFLKVLRGNTTSVLFVTICRPLLFADVCVLSSLLASTSADDN
jgi:hypothetical protein